MNNKSEKIIDRILGYLTLSIILLLLGLLFRDSLGFRGFPFGWYHHPGYIKYELLIASFVVLLSVTICAAVLSAVIGGIREPVMKDIKAKAPETNTIKASALADKKVKVSKEIKPKELDLTEIKKVLKPVSKSSSGDKKEESISKFAIIGLIIVMFCFPLFEYLDEDDYDSGYDDGTYDYELTDDTEFMSEAANEAVYSFMNGYFENLSDIGDTSSIEGFEFPDESGFEEFGNSYVYSTDDTEQMAFRYIIHDDASDEYSGACLVGVLVETSYDGDPSDNAEVTGMCVYNFTSYDEYQDYLDDPSRWITPAECFIVGKTEIDDTFILNVFDD